MDDDGIKYVTVLKNNWSVTIIFEAHNSQTLNQYARLSFKNILCNSAQLLTIPA